MPQIGRIDLAKYVYMLLMFLWCAYTGPFLKPFDKDYLFTSILYILIYAFYYIHYCRNKKMYGLYLIMGVMAFWYIGQCVKCGGLTSIDFRLIYSVVLCHVSFYLYRGKEFFWYMEKVLVHLTILSLVVWGLGVVLSEPMRSLVSRISVWDNGSTTYGNMILVALGNQYSSGILRNIGFTWEAGRFASFLVIGLFNNLIIHRFRLRNNKAFWIFVAGVLSTLSTTGVGAAGGVFFMYLYNRSVKIKLALIVLCIIIFPSAFALDFIGGKLSETINVSQELHNMAYTFHVYNADQITPQRFTGLYLDFLNWMHDFWFGYNLNENSYAESVLFEGFSVWVSDGLINIFSKYGLFVGLLFYWNLFRSSAALSADFGYKGKFFFALIFMLISISYDFWSSAIMLHYVLYYLYTKRSSLVEINYC